MLNTGHYKACLHVIWCPKTNTENVDLKNQNQKVVEQCYHQNGLYVVLKNQDFLKEQETKGILSCLGLETLLRKIP